MQHQFQASLIPSAPQPAGEPQTSAVRTDIPEGEQTQQTDEDHVGSGASQFDEGMDGDDGEKSGKPLSGRRSGRSATMTNEEWTRQRKDNHVSSTNTCGYIRMFITNFVLQKEVERRRRGNINEGINELGRIVPNGSGEKAKGAILNRAVQYIHHLKENEARNIEKWTLEKLLMDQAMGDLQAQLEEMRRLWEGERDARQRVEAEVAMLKGVPPGEGDGGDAGEKDARKDGNKRPRDGEDGAAAEGDADDRGKRPRTD